MRPDKCKYNYDILDYKVRMAFTNVVLAPFECGQKKKGVGKGAYDLYEIYRLNCSSEPKTNVVMPTEKIMDGYEELYNCLCSSNLENNKVLLLGGDHSIGQSSVASSLKKVGEDNLVVIWVDAHADTNTYEASITKNLHGTPLAGIMGYEKMWFNFDLTLKSKNLLYFGIRDLDDFEKKKISENNIFFTSKFDELVNHIDKMKSDNSNLKFHISWDVDSLDPKFLDSTGCVVDNGLPPSDIIRLYKYVENDLVALDVVEYNPELGDNNKSSDTMKEFFKSIM